MLSTHYTYIQVAPTCIRCDPTDITLKGKAQLTTGNLFLSLFLSSISVGVLSAGLATYDFSDCDHQDLHFVWSFLLRLSCL